jgi:hypothetical protein
MALIRTLAILTFGLAIAYSVPRAVATACSGIQCDTDLGASL